MVIFSSRSASFSSAIGSAIGLLNTFSINKYYCSVVYHLCCAICHGRIDTQPLNIYISLAYLIRHIIYNDNNSLYDRYTFVTNSRCDLRRAESCGSENSCIMSLLERGVICTVVGHLCRLPPPDWEVLVRDTWPFREFFNMSLRWRYNHGGIYALTASANCSDCCLCRVLSCSCCGGPSYLNVTPKGSAFSCSCFLELALCMPAIRLWILSRTFAVASSIVCLFFSSSSLPPPRGKPTDTFDSSPIFAPASLRRRSTSLFPLSARFFSWSRRLGETRPDKLAGPFSPSRLGCGRPTRTTTCRGADSRASLVQSSEHEFSRADGGRPEPVGWRNGTNGPVLGECCWDWLLEGTLCDALGELQAGDGAWVATMAFRR